MECRLCKQKEFIEIYKVRDYIIGGVFSVVKCKKCGFIQTNAECHLSSYPSVYYGTSNKKLNDLFNKIQYLLVKKNCDYTVKTTLETGRVLDIGCGNGFFLKEMQKRGWHVHGTEATADAANFTYKSSGIQPIIDQDLTHPKLRTTYFDLVTMWHVLEHVEQPAEHISKIRGLLNDVGYLIIEVPNIESLQAKLFGKNWFHLDVPRHISHFSLRTLTKLLLNNKYSIVKTETFSWGHGLYGWMQSVANLIFGDKNTTYKMLKMGVGCKGGKNALKIIFFIVIAPVAALLEIFASLAGQGAVVRITAKKVV